MLDGNAARSIPLSVVGTHAFVAITIFSRNRLDGANDWLGAIDGSRVEQIDPEVERLTNECYGFRLTLPCAEAKAAEPATA
jgi:hypothetical protein